MKIAVAIPQTENWVVATAVSVCAIATPILGTLRRVTYRWKDLSNGKSHALK